MFWSISSNVTLKIFWKLFNKIGIIFSIEYVIPVSLVSDVTPLSVMPQGSIWENQDRSLSQFNDIPWVVIYLEACIPIAAILLSPTHTPVCGDLPALTPAIITNSNYFRF